MGDYCMNVYTSAQTPAIDWDAYAACYDTLNMLTPYREQIDRVAHIITTLQPARVLDVGCGTGNLLETLTQYNIPAALFGIDSSRAMLLHAYTKTNATIIQGFAHEHLPFGDAVFDAVICMQVLYTIKNPSRILIEIYRTLKPGGHILLITPTATHDAGLVLKAHAQSTKPDTYWTNPHASEMREHKLLREACNNSTFEQSMRALTYYNRMIAAAQHFHFFTKEAVYALLTQCGFIVVQYETIYAHQCHCIVAKRYLA